MSDDVKKKVGRPSKGKRGTFTFRVSAELREKLEAAATLHKKSVSEEIETRLERSFEAATEAARIQAIRQAGFNIVREHGGKVAVQVSSELLLAEADGILRSGFFPAEDVTRSPMEIAIENAVARAFERAGIKPKDEI